MDTDPYANSALPEELLAVFSLVHAALPTLDGVPDESNKTMIADNAYAESLTKEEIDRLVADEVDKASRTVPPRPVDTPLGCKVELLPHQKEGLGYLCQWIKDPSYHGGIIANDMGLGETLLLISALLKHPPTAENLALIVVPSSLMEVWQQEFTSKTCGDVLRVLYVHPSLERAVCKDSLTPAILAEYNVIVTTHNQFGREPTTKDEHKYTYRVFLSYLRPS
jgi:SNF2 family DNA or RNA helicase